MLVMASCSSRVTPADFFDMVERSRQRSRTSFSGVLHTGHALDHPVGYAEGAYLKCLFATAAN